MSSHRVRVYALPEWLDAERLLGAGDWEFTSLGSELRSAQAELSGPEAADLGARLRGLGVGGAPLAVEIGPGLSRAQVRAARTEDSRRRRSGTPATESGIRLELDEQARYSWTPEILGRELARARSPGTVVDAMCGAGGNAIAFALEGWSVLAIERDADRLGMARENARRMGVAERIDFREGDACELVRGERADLLFLDPPWGTEWNRSVAGASELAPLLDLLDGADSFESVWAKLPPSIDLGTLPGSWHAQAVFGEAQGDHRRMKFVWARREKT